MLLGISSYTYTWAVGVSGYPDEGEGLTAMKLIEKAAEMGVQVVQICDNLPLHKLSKEQLIELKDCSEDLGISIEVGTRGIEPEHIRRYLEIAEFLKSNILRTILYKSEGIIDEAEAIFQIKAILGELETKRIKLAIENHEKHSVRELVSIVKAIDSEYVGICLDTVNSFGALEAPGEVIETLAPYTINLHYKDFIIKRIGHQMGFEIVGSPAGAGRINTRELFTLIKSYGKDPNVILELWTPYVDNIKNTILKESTWAKESINYLKEWVK